MAVRIIQKQWELDTGGKWLCSCLSGDGAQIGVGTEQTATILDASNGKEVAKLANNAGPVTAIKFTGKDRLVVAIGGSVRLWRIDSGALLKDVHISNGSKADRVFLCPHPDDALLAAVSVNGRHVYILDYELNVLSQLVIPPKYGEISGLLWLSRTAVLATSAEALLVWRHFDSDTKPALILGQAMGLTIASASWKTLTLAAASRDGVVYIWTVVEDKKAEQPDEAFSATLRSTLKEYPYQVHVLSWDGSGRYLATSGGTSDATIWEVSKLIEDHTHATLCVGHTSPAEIVEAAFQDDGTVLVTAGNDGSILFFDSDKFLPGEHAEPIASISSDFGKEPISSILWSTGGRLLASNQAGKLGFWNLSRSSTEDVKPSTRTPEAKQESPEPTLLQASSSKKAEIQTPSSAFSQLSLGPKKATRPYPDASRSSVNSSNGALNRRQSTPRNHGLLPKLSNQSITLSDKSSSVRSQGGAEIRREALDTRRDERSPASSSQLQPSLLSADALSQPSGSLTENQSLQQRNSSGGLSPALWQQIQNVGKKRPQQSGPREPAGWGMGSPTPPLANQQHMHVPVPGAMPVPVSPTMMGQMGPHPLFMMPNQAMGPQPFPGQPGYPHVTPFPVMTPPSPSGMVEGASMQPFPHPMMYMQVPHGIPPQAPGWPQMMPGPWMTPYMMHPSHQGVQKPVGVMPVARAFSVPDEQIHWNQGSQGSAPTRTSLGHDQAELHKNAISLPYSTTDEWRAGMKESKETRRSSGTATKGEQGDEEAAAQKQDTVAAEELGGEEAEYAANQEKFGNNTIYVGNLAQAITETQLQQVFQDYGTIVHTQVIRDKQTQVSRGFGFVSFAEPASVRQAIAEINGKKLFGVFTSRSLKVSTSNRPVQGR